MFDFENDLQLSQPNPDDNNYYQEYCRLFLANIALTHQVKELIEQKNHLKYRLSKYEDDQCMSSYERNQKGKRFRRNAHEIQRFYKCTVKSCAKSYGSEGSLNQHYKLKHPEIYASLPNVQSSLCPNGLPIQNSFTGKNQDFVMEKLTSPIKQYLKNSNSKLNSILKELGDARSFRSIKIEELKEYEFDDNNKENQHNMNVKENLCMNIQSKFEKPSLITLNKKQDNFMSFNNQLNISNGLNTNSDQQNSRLKRSSRMIKKRDFNF